MAKMPETVRLELHGVEKLIEGHNRAMVELRPHRERLIHMGWSPAMADAFLAEIAEIILREVFKGLSVTT